MLTRILLITGLLAASFSASARDFEDSYAVYGAGGDNCSTYLEAMEKGGKELDYFIDWVVGYFSAFNVIMPSTYDLMGKPIFPPRNAGWSGIASATPDSCLSPR